LIRAVDYVISWDRYRERGVPRPYVTLSLAVDLALGEKLQLVARHRCPYCKAYFQTKAGIANHLRRSRCSEMLKEDIEMARRVYNALQDVIKHSGYINYVCFKVSNNIEDLATDRICLSFRSKRNLVKLLRKILETKQIVIPIETPPELEEILKLKAAIEPQGGIWR